MKNFQTVITVRQAVRENKWQKSNKRNSQKERICRFERLCQKTNKFDAEAAKVVYERDQRIQNRKQEKRHRLLTISQAKKQQKRERGDSHRDTQNH
jgi:hypothetical protein